LERYLYSLSYVRGKKGVKQDMRNGVKGKAKEKQETEMQKKKVQ
jgi:hypothetical protein